MNPILKNILAVIAGLIIGSIVNYGLLQILNAIIPPPEGMASADLESIKESMSQFQTKHFIPPFLAHALGTLAGAFTAAKIAASSKLTMALIIGFFFLFGGISMVVMIPSTPTWFILLDLIVAYIPMAWLGKKWAE